MIWRTVLAVLVSGLVACAPPPTSQPESPIEAPLQRWTWVPFNDTRCGNGTSTGLGINPAADVRTLVIYLQGGGACSDGPSCFGIAPSAVNMANGYGSGEFSVEGNVNGGIVFLDRTRIDNPLRDAHLVFVPYCTGDLHAGDAEAIYEVLGTDRTAHHRGFLNMSHFLERVVPTFPRLERVVLAGASAGGFGAVFNAHRVQAAFGDVRVDVLSDSGPPIAVPSEVVSQWQLRWSLQLPSECDACAAEPWKVMEFHLARHPSSRWALLASQRDGVLAHFSALSEAEMAEAVDALLGRMESLPTARAFVTPGSGHVVIADPFAQVDGVTLSDWLKAFADSDPSWRTARP